jgi:hypothetical protein
VTAVADIELHRVARGPAHGFGTRHHVLDTGSSGEPAGQLFGERGRAHHANVEHRAHPSMVMALYRHGNAPTMLALTNRSSARGA